MPKWHYSMFYKLTQSAQSVACHKKLITQQGNKVVQMFTYLLLSITILLSEFVQVCGQPSQSWTGVAYCKWSKTGRSIHRNKYLYIEQPTLGIDNFVTWIDSWSLEKHLMRWNYLPDKNWLLKRVSTTIANTSTEVILNNDGFADHYIWRVAPAQ